MNGSLHPLRLALGVSGSLLSLGLALAQGQGPAGNQQQAPNSPGAVSAQQGQPGAPGQAGQGGQAGQAGQFGQAGRGQGGMQMAGMPGQIGDREMAEALLIDNQGEVAMAQFALQKTQNEDVKKFAQKLIDDHQKMIESLTKLGAGQGQAGQGQAGQGQAGQGQAGQGQAQQGTGAVAGNDRRNSVNPGAAELQPGRGQMGGATDFVSLKHELGQQCLQSGQRELGSKQGAEFDKCYIGMQIGKHQEAADVMTVFRRHANGQLGQTIDEGLPVVQAHLEHAKQLIKQLESSTPTTASGEQGSKR